MDKKKVTSQCPLCGEEIPEDEAVCSYCGALVTEPGHDAISDEQDLEDDL